MTALLGCIQFWNLILASVPWRCECGAVCGTGVLNTHQVLAWIYPSGICNGFVGWSEGDKCGFSAHLQQPATCTTWLDVHCGLLVGEIARFTAACDNRCSLLATNRWRAAVDRADGRVWSAFSDSFLLEWLLSCTVGYWLAFCFLFIVWVYLFFNVVWHID